MLVRSPLLTSHKWRKLVPSGRLVYRFNAVFLWCYVCLVFFRFRLDAFVETAALRSIALRYTGAPIATRVSFSFLEMSLFRVFLFLFWRCRFSRVLFVPFPLSLCMQSTSYVLFFRVVCSYLVTTGWIFFISLCENSINQPIN